MGGGGEVIHKSYIAMAHLRAEQTCRPLTRRMLEVLLPFHCVGACGSN